MWVHQINGFVQNTPNIFHLWPWEKMVETDLSEDFESFPTSFSVPNGKNNLKLYHFAGKLWKPYINHI